jgi:hypothetical protein
MGSLGVSYWSYNLSMFGVLYSMDSGYVLWSRGYLLIYIGCRCSWYMIGIIPMGIMNDFICFLLDLSVFIICVVLCSYYMVMLLLLLSYLYY